MSNFETVLVSVCTSAVVALAVEWMAKPSLEARKERILERHQAEREIARQLRTIVSIAGSLDFEIPHTASNADRSRILSWLEERRRAIVEAGRELNMASVSAGPKTGARTLGIVGYTAGRAQGIALSDKLRRQVSQELYLVAGTTLDLVSTPKWRFLRRRKLFSVADALRRVDSEG